MRRRRLRLALLTVALFGVVAWLIVVWLIWPTSSAFITGAKEKYARLQLGMSEAEMAAILGDSPERDRQYYGEWTDASDGRKWYKLTDPPDAREPKPGERLYNWRAYNFDDRDRPGGPRHYVHIQVYLDQGRLVAATYYESHDNTVKKWLRGLPFRPTRVLPYLDTVVEKGRKAIPPP